MVAFSFYSRIYRNLKRVWRRRKYQRLDNSGNRNLRIVRLGGNKRRVLKIRTIPKLLKKPFSPIKLLTLFRDAYIDAMIGFATSAAALNGGYGFGRKKVTSVSRPALFKTKIWRRACSLESIALSQRRSSPLYE